MTYTDCISGTNMNVINMHRTVSEKSKELEAIKYIGHGARKYTCYIPMSICHRRHSPTARWLCDIVDMS